MPDMLFTAEQVSERPAPPMGAMFIGVAYWAPGGWWGLRPERLEADPHKISEILDRLPAGWISRRIYKLVETKR
jgi:hypothetical protein